MKKLLVYWDDLFKRFLAENLLSPRVQKVALAFILLGCVLARLETLSVPLLDRSYWKEIDYITISQNYWKHGFNFFMPEISWPAEPPRYTAMELPLVPYLAALLYAGFGFGTLTVRSQTMLAFLLLSLYLFRLGKRELGAGVGLLAAAASAVMPLYHDFGRLLFSDPWTIALLAVALFHFAEWTDFARRKDWLLAMGAFSLAVALKLEPLYSLLPLLWIAFRRHKLKLSAYKSYVYLVLCALVLPLIWYAYSYHLATTYLDVFGVFPFRGGHNKFQTVAMLSDPHWYREMYSQLTWGILGGKIGTCMLLIGMMAALRVRKGGLFAFSLLAVTIYFAIVAEGQLDAPYRQFAAYIPFSGFVALGAAAIATFLLASLHSSGRWILDHRRQAIFCLLGGLVLVASLALRRRNEIFGRDPTLAAHPPAWELGQYLKQHASPTDKLIAVGEYTIHKGGKDLSPVIYYYSGLQGWTIQAPDWNLKRIEELRQKGATFLVARRAYREPSSFPFLEEMRSRYRLLYATEEGFILDLHSAM